MKELFLWDDDLGIGYYPVDETENVYDRAYFKKYITYEDTPIGKGINDFRVEFTNTYCKGKVLDIGIGCGTFVGSRSDTYGYDVNPTGIEWLEMRDKFVDPYLDDITSFAGLTFFDSFEHIKNPRSILRQIKNQHVIMSVPIFKDREHALASKHFRPDEHYHYFTHTGLITYMHGLGFSFCWVSDNETKLGRDEIYTYAFFK